ncbi:S9 family peptidase [Roseimarinus sediminis]|uniref:S9 family peptidase n=1 Tax=Roseimarinus sediminis TaxID=1610899 RepID=UPI003D205C34
MMKFLTFFSCLIILATSGRAQVTADDYRRADSVSTFSNLVYNANVDVNWMDETSTFWYKVKTRRGTEYKLADAENSSLKPAFDHEKLCEKLNELSKKKDYKPYELNLRKLEYSENGKVLTFEMAKYKWEYNLSKNKLEEKGKVKERPSRDGYWGSTEGRYERGPVTSPDSSSEAFVKEYNLWVKNIESGEETQLSFDGSEGEFYSGHIQWSPDSKKIAVNKVRRHTPKHIQFVESSPEGQLQPKLHQREYLKPGDALPIEKPSLFDVENREKIEIDTRPFEHQYSLSNLKWWPDGEAFTFEFNQRGHQLYQLAEVDGNTGEVRILIDESSETFIDYSGKRFRHDIDSTKEIIWASERDGWNHLYLYDARDGKVKNQITKGEWVVRGVEHVDEENRRIIFKASGMNAGEDPYFIHYYSVDFDGSNLKELTPEAMNHQAVFSHDHRYFVDTYSAVTHAPVSVLRRSSDGKVLMELEKADISELLEAGWKYPEVFVAKARDDQTDIWGNIYYPTNFDSTRSYPVIEYIYAGPHSSFAQKSFSAYHYAYSGLAELGFIVVQMDGMGTSNRSKAFHDVCYKNLKDAGFPDRIKWIKAAAETRPFMDTTRVGIFGGSAGGQSSMGALLFHPEFYYVAVSACGCHDNRMDKIWWNEQWMGFPIGKHYEESSNVCNAHRLQGNLMLIVGEMDDNVDPASTMQVADALIKAQKDFELVVLPGVNHTLGGEYGERKRRDFFVKHLLGAQTPRWNRIEVD